MEISFSPHKDFLAPYVGAASRLEYISDEYLNHLEKTLEERGMETGRILATRRASEYIVTSRPLILLADFDERLAGGDALIEIVRVIGTPERGVPDRQPAGSSD